MKASVLITFTASLFVAVSAFAQKDTAHHREVFNAINKAEASMQKVMASHKEEPTEFALTGYLQGGEVKKIVSLCSDDGSGPVEYYLEGEQPLFVYTTWYKMTEDGKRGAKVEERLYYKDGEIFKWLTTEKPAPVFHGEDYQATTEMHTANCAAFVAALKKAASKSSGKAQAAGKVVEGTFTGIEQGDYFHWNMTTKSGEEVSYFIMRPDDSVEKVTENPEKYIGKKCRVTWKKSTENIPEAGGKMEIEQILSVEWLGKK
ncbi:MAG: hypothetical protein IPK22_16385 [Verrucomicrobiaceae bacterium]|nr:hypothetical protein [Verrucomicrobiaceae bacterium]